MTSPAIRLYLVSPETLPGEALLPAFLTSVEQALAACDVAAFLIRLKDMDDTALRQAALAVKDRIHAAGVALLLEDAVEIARDTGADGVHLTGGAAAVRNARALGGDMIIGAACAMSRHAAMECAEAGADYVAFGGNDGGNDGGRDGGNFAAGLDLANWWAEIAQTPCVFMPRGPFGPEELAGLGEIEAEFLALPPAMWAGDGVDGISATGLAAIGRALRGQTETA